MLRDRLCVAVVALLLCGALTAMAQGRPDEVAVIVNGEPISTWEIGMLLPQIQAEMASQGLEAKGEILIKTALERAIDSRLLAQEARRQGIEPNAERVDEKMTAMAERAGGRAAFEAELIKTPITYSQIRATVVQADLVQSLVESELGADIDVSEEDVATFYAENADLFKSPDKIHTRHILFLVEADASSAQRATAREKAVAAHERAVAGEDFALLAKDLSEGPNAPRGGDLGFTAHGQMVESFDDAVWAHEVGEISEVVESRLGYHVIKVEEIVIGPTASLEQAQPLVEDLLRQKRTRQALSILVSVASCSRVRPLDRR